GGGANELAARTAGPASAITSAAAGNRSASCSTTLGNCSCTADASSWAKIERTSVATNGPADFGTFVSRFLRKWVLHRCHEAPGRVEAIASTRPGWASEITRRTPESARATRPRRNAVQPAPSSGGVQVKAQD